MKNGIDFYVLIELGECMQRLSISEIVSMFKEGQF